MKQKTTSNRKFIINKDTESINICENCQNNNTVNDKRYSTFLGLVKPYEVKKCTKCSLRWLSPRPTQQAYKELYSAENYFSASTGHKDYDISLERRNNQFDKRLTKIREYFCKNSTIELLDVGAANGFFVNKALLAGFNASGIELSDDMRKEAQQKYGVTLLSGTLDNLGTRDQYDVVHINHVFEHVQSPEYTMCLLYSLLKPNGLLVLEVPQQFDNDIERIKRLLGQKKTVFDAYSLHHTYFYSPKTLSSIITRSGFTIEQIKTANLDVVPFFPLSMKNIILRFILWQADYFRKAGNIIEVFARKK